ncbi:biotin transporter BioY [Candidatus Bipolaricaulota sp. J31]
MVIADVFAPTAARSGTRTAYNAAVILAGSLLTALAARFSLSLPFSPVPITGQTFAVLLVGALLGRYRGALSMGLYLLWGVLGLPVFAGGTGGLARLMGPTGGYLLGFVAAAWTTGFLAQRGWDRRTWSCILAMALGNLVIYLFGLPWLAFFVGVERAIPLGLLPFLPGDAVKLALAAALLPMGWKILTWLGKT